MIGKAEAAEASRRAPHLPPGEPGKPRRVERLDGGPDYYLVPWETNRGTAGLVLVDGEGGVLGVSLSPEPGPSPLLDPIPGARLVWQPCQESTSPARPFYEIVHPGGDITYVDMSGRESDRLTPLGRG